MPPSWTRSHTSSSWPSTATGGLFWNGEALHRDALAPRFEAVRQDNPELHLRADRNTRYEKVAEVMAEAQRAGIAKIAFVTEPAQR